MAYQHVRVDLIKGVGVNVARGTLRVTAEKLKTIRYGGFLDYPMVMDIN